MFLFFALSGYWIRQMWVQEYASTDAPYRNFLISRLWRIFPVYYVAVLLWLLAQSILRTPRLGLPNAEGFAAVHFYFSHLFLLGYASLPHGCKPFFQMWSIDIELQFYLIAPFLITILSRFSWCSWQMVTVYVTSAFGILAFVLFYNGPGHFTPQSASLPMFLVFFLIGLHSAQYKWQPSKKLSEFGLLIACLFVVICILMPSSHELLSTHKVHAPGLPEYNAIANMFIALLIAPYAMATVRKGLNKTSRLGSLDRVLGSLSYEVYVLHIIAAIILDHYFGHIPRLERLPFVTAAVAAILPFSWLVYHFVDRPIDSARVAWVKSRRRGVGSPAPAPWSGLRRDVAP